MPHRLALAAIALSALLACRRADGNSSAPSSTQQAAQQTPDVATPRVDRAPSDPHPEMLPAAPGAGDSAGASARARDSAASSSATALVPLVSGLTLVSALHFPNGDRESVIAVNPSPEGVLYTWRFREHRSNGDTVMLLTRRFVRANDLASAPRLNMLFRARAIGGRDGAFTDFKQADEDETPGFTAFSLSRAAYAQLRAQKEIPYSVAALDAGPLGPNAAASLQAIAPVDITTSRVTLRGTLAMVSADPAPMPILLNGRRTTLPAVHLEGRFAMQDMHEEQDYWVLADSTHPLILRIATGNQIEQIVRIDFPVPTESNELEKGLAAECRIELPGVYFDFNSATLQPASEPSLSNLAALLKRHPDWTLDVEGHTDSIGTAPANLELSNKRAEAVRTALLARYGIPPAQLRSVGYAASRPRESNSTLEGRARNRRVELSRKCDKQ